MLLTDAKIRTLKPSDNSLKSPILTVCIFLSNRAAPVTGISTVKETRIALGAYSAVSLSEAHQQREGIRKMLALKINPAQQRAAERGSRTPERIFRTMGVVMARKQ